MVGFAGRGARLLASLACCLLLVAPGGAAEGEAPSRVGFSIAAEPRTPGTFVIAYRGPIAYPFAANLSEIIAELPASAKAILLDLDSEGGSIQEAVTASERLRRAGERLEMDTRVGHGSRCLSSCVVVFLQGRRRLASAASAWGFHGACRPMTNVPSPASTARLVGLLRAGGVSEQFLSMLDCAGYLSAPGQLWLSGYQLFHVHKAGVITELLPDWSPEAPVVPPFDPGVRAR